MSEPLPYLLDSDGPLTRFYERIRQLRAHDPGWAPRSYNLFEGLDLAEVERLKLAIKSPGFVLSIEATEGAREAVRRLREIAPVRVVTTPWPGAPYWEDERRLALAEHYEIAPHDVVFVEDKSVIPGRALLEDHVENAHSWARRQGRPAILWDMFHNRGPEAEGLPRVRGWAEALPALLRAGGGGS